jgi:biopolymer transport protein ExbD
MLQKGVDVRLPLADNTVDKPDSQEQTVVAIDSRNGFHLNGIAIAQSEMAARVKRALEEKNERVVLIKGDADASYSAIMQAMDDLRQAGIEDIGLITEPKTPRGPTAGGM